MTLPMSILDIFRSLANLPWGLWAFLLVYALWPMAERLIEDYLDSLRFARAGLKNVKNMSGEDFGNILD